MRNTLFIIFTFICFFASSHVTHADEFEAIWSAIESRSPGIKSEAIEKEAAELQLSRAKGHWAPRLLLNAGVVSTNDPATSLFSTLGSRSLQATDLNPSLMNSPERQIFKNGNIVLDWALYEGGSREYSVKGASLLSESQAISVSARRNELYAELARDYGKLLALNAERADLLGLKEKLSRLVDRYRVGSRDNPVGYSGLLGMRSLIHRLEGILAENSAGSESLLESIRIRSGIESIQVSSITGNDPVDFMKGRLQRNLGNHSSSSLRVMEMRLRSTAQSEFSMAERSRWLPRVGLFARGNLLSGPRDTGTSTDLGAYLQWTLFDASNVGAYREASLRSSASMKRSEELAEKSLIVQRGLQTSLPMLEGNLKRARASLEITAEQVAVTESLFKNGSVNALQFAEVLSRRADVIESRKQIELALLDQLSESFLQNASPL
jgi:hypothetical protein